MNIARFAFVVGCLSLVACGGSEEAATASDTGTVPLADTATADTATTETGASDLEVEYVAVGSGLTVGKSHAQLRITSGGAPATGLAESIAITPLMVMPKMSHGNPVPIDAVKESAVPGTYDATLFFTMASVDASGNPAGQWKLGVAVGKAAPVSLDVTVAKAAGTDTTHTFLRNAADTFNAMGSPKMRNYVLFRDTLTPTGSGGHKLVLFLATVQEGMMVWPPLTTGLKLTDGTGKVQLTIDSVAVEVSTDGTTFAPMTCDATARCSATLSGLTAGTAAKVMVKLKINGKDYTTDGAAPDLSDPTKINAYATFSLTPGGT